MLHVVDKPLIQYAVEEAYAAGIGQMIFDTGRTKRSVEKPAPEVAPTTLAVASRYILTPGIFKELESIPLGVGGPLRESSAQASPVCC